MSPDTTVLPGSELLARAKATESLSSSMPWPRTKGAGSTEPVEILIWHQHNHGQLPMVLEALGHHVTLSPTLPGDLSSYEVIWHVGAHSAVSASEQAQLAAFLAQGKGVHLSGERPCCEALNGSWTTFLNALVVDGGITIGHQGDIFAVTGAYGQPYAVNPEALERVAIVPNRVENLRLLAAGGMAGLASMKNILVSGRSRTTGETVPVGAIWDGHDLVGGSGRLTMLMDVNWFGFPASAHNAAMIQNLQRYLQGANARPVARAGQTLSRDCLRPGELVPVALDGSLSSDADGHALTYAWYEDNVRIAIGMTPTVSLAVGEHDIVLVVNDGQVDSEPDQVHISLVADSEPPVIDVGPMIELWPPDHSYHLITLGDCVARVSDTCDASLDPSQDGALVSIYSDEPERSAGGGNTCDDIVILDRASFEVRAERQGHGNGRVYGARFAVTDAAGNTTTATCHVGVRHCHHDPPAVDDGPGSGYTVVP